MEAIDLAKYIVAKCIYDTEKDKKKRLLYIDNLQLQNILYCVQMDFLKRGKRAFYEKFEVTAFGVMIPEVFYYYCGYGVMPITDSFEENWREIIQNKEDKKVINHIINEKRKLAPWEWADELKKTI